MQYSSPPEKNKGDGFVTLPKMEPCVALGPTTWSHCSWPTPRSSKTFLPSWPRCYEGLGIRGGFGCPEQGPCLQEAFHRKAVLVLSRTIQGGLPGSDSSRAGRRRTPGKQRASSSHWGGSCRQGGPKGGGCRQAAGSRRHGNVACSPEQCL